MIEETDEVNQPLASKLACRKVWRLPLPCPVHFVGIKIAYDNTQQPVISLSFHVFKETPYLCSKAFFFLNTARIAIPNALMTNKEVNRPTFV